MASSKERLYAAKVGQYQREYAHQPVCNMSMLNLVPPTARRVLDIGCCMGGAGRELKRRQPCQVWGVEIAPELARIASQHYERVIVGDIEDEAVWQQLPKGSFDAVICGEVLEHLVAPQRVLKRLHEVITPDATLVLSVPHVGHASVIRRLLAGDWDYDSTGILDDSHLRFFGRKNLWRWLMESGWLVSHSLPALVPDPIPQELERALLGSRWATRFGLEESQIMGFALAARPLPPDLARGNEPTDGLVSIIVLNWNNLPYLRRCVGSVFAHTRPPFELIIVDNGSTDGSRRYLKALVRQHRNVKVVLNPSNIGAPAGRNCGLALAEGDFLAFLDSDTVVTNGWLERLLRWMEIDPTLGMVGPCSNFASGQQIEVDYRNLKEMHEFAQRWCERNCGSGLETSALISFCVLMRRSVIEAIGGMDARFGLIMHEDIDHSLRARVAGFRCWLALDAFVHHYGNRTSGRLGVERMMDAAWPRFKEKWNLPPEAERFRPSISLVPELFHPRHRPPCPQDLYEPLPDRNTLRVLEGGKGRPLLSLCMITKDEADALPRCLESVKGIVDEIVVVDTGSTDETPQIAEGYGAKVIRFTWTGSFSDARNESLKHATGEWILWLDADEALAEGKENLRRILEQAPEEVGFILPMVSFVGHRPHREGHVHPAFRLFRNLPGLRFHRNLHEQIVASIRQVRPDAKFGALPVWIEHYGYLTPWVRRKQKVARNLELAKRDLRANPSDPFAWYNLGREYQRLAQWERAFYCLRRALFHLGDTFPPYLVRCLCDMVRCLIHLGRSQQALALLEEAHALPLEAPDLWMLEGEIRWRLGQWALALEAFRKALASSPTLPLHFDWSEGAASYGAWYWMGLCHQRMGQWEEALRCFGRSLQEALVRHRYYEPAIASLVQQKLLRPSAEGVLETLEQWTPRGLAAHPTLMVLAAKAALEPLPLPPSALKLAQTLLAMAEEQGRNGEELAFVRGKMLLLQRRYAEAARWLARVPPEAPEGGMALGLRLLAHALAQEWEEVAALEVEDPLWRGLMERWQTGQGPKASSPLPEAWRAHFPELLALLLQLEEFQRYEEALALLDGVFPDEVDKGMALGALYGRFGLWELVTETLLPLAFNGGMPREGWLLLAQACHRLGHHEEAEKILLRLLQEANGAEEALQEYLLLAGTYIAQGKSQEAQQVLDWIAQGNFGFAFGEDRTRR